MQPVGPLGLLPRYNDSEKQTTVELVRKQSAAQRAAARAADARRAAAARAEAARRAAAAARAAARRAVYVANWKASAKPIPYKQLDKDPDKFAG
jgi:hypothetical protein